MTIKFPNALLQNQAAVITDRIDNGDWVKENVNPGIDSHTSPNIINVNWGNCHKIDILLLSFDKIRLSMWHSKIAAHKNDKAAQMPPILMLFKGDIRIL